jgi:hypothetical protein
MNVRTATAADLRSFFRADPKRMEALSPEAQVTVREGARGKVHPEAVALHNKRRRTVQYVTGATKATASAAKAEAQAQRAAAAKAGHTVGKRGPLPKAFRESLAQSKG